MKITVPKEMIGVQLTGHGGFEKLEYNENIPVPTPKYNEVLIQVLASGINNTDINTRIGWYSKSVTTQTSEGAQKGINAITDNDASWSGKPLTFPLVQGADVCGRIVKTGEGVDPVRTGQRVIVAPMQPQSSENPWDCITMGSEINGGFAQYVIARASMTYAVNCDWTDVELASIPCAWSTAENLLHRSKVTDNDVVLITGSSGGVGSAAIQLAKRRGAHVIAVTTKSKTEQVMALGADRAIYRDDDLIKTLGSETINVVCDLVAGPQWAQLIGVLKRGGRYAVAGAIAGPIVELDIRTLYLKDLTFIGCTFQEPQVFKNLVSYIETNEITPIVAHTYPLKDIAKAQTEFLSKAYMGKLVLIPPHDV